MIKSIYQEDIIITNVHTFDKKCFNIHEAKTDIYNGELHKFTIIVGKFYTLAQ